MFLEDNSYKNIPIFNKDGRSYIDLNGVNLDLDVFENERRKYYTTVREIVEHYNQIPLFKLLKEDSRTELLREFGLEQWIGIPPALEKRNIQRIRTKKCSTYGLIATIFIKILSELDCGGSLEGALAQLHEAVSLTCQKAEQNQNRLAPQILDNHEITITESLSPVGPSIRWLEGKAYTTLQTSHIVMIGYDGMMLVLRVPTPAEMFTIIKTDQTMRDHLLTRDLFGESHFDLPPYKSEYQGIEKVEELFQLLIEEGYGERINDGSWTDVHTLLRHVPFDVLRHIDQQTLKVLFSKPAKESSDFQ